MTETMMKATTSSRLLVKSLTFYAPTTCGPATRLV
jgi:hypothetical protein